MCEHESVSSGLTTFRGLSGTWQLVLQAEGWTAVRRSRSRVSAVGFSRAHVFLPLKAGDQLFVELVSKVKS